MSAIVYIGLGSNLNDPVAQIDKAIMFIGDLPGTVLIQSSSFIQNPPMGPQDQPDFVNAVISISTRLLPLELLEALQTIEISMGRVKTRVWGPRVIDCDILVYGDESFKSEQLTIPHPGIRLRPFVLYPLLEIAPDLVLPDGSALANIKMTEIS